MSATPLSLTQIIGRITQGLAHAESLPTKWARILFVYRLTGVRPNLAADVLWAVCHIKRKSADELDGFATTIGNSMALIVLDTPYRLIIRPSYNGARRSANLLPLIALALARYGLPVLVHGSVTAELPEYCILGGHSPFDRIKNAQVLTTFGLAMANDAAGLTQQLHPHCLTYLSIDQPHSGFGRMLALCPQRGVHFIADAAVEFINLFVTSTVHHARVMHPPYLAKLQIYFIMPRRIARYPHGIEKKLFAHTKNRPNWAVCQSRDNTLWPTKYTTSLRSRPVLPESRDLAATCRFMPGPTWGRTPPPQPELEPANCLLRLSGRSSSRDRAYHLRAQTPLFLAAWSEAPL
ncbi:MAG: hypothetical protein ACYDEV_00925 [Acidiferrobacter sp.]